MRINRVRQRLALRVRLDLRLELVDRVRARAGNGLISRRKITLQAKRPVQRPQRHERDGRRAVGIGDDSLVLAQAPRD